MTKLYKRAGYVVLPIAIVLFAVLLKWEEISYFTIRKVARFYADRAHIEIDIGRIGGNPFSETTVENVILRPEGRQPQAYHFKAQSITCSYNLWNLRDGLEFFLQGLKCTANNPALTYDLRSAVPQDQASDKPIQFLVPAVLPGLEVHNGTVVLTGSGWDAGVRGLNAGLQSAAGNHELLLEAKNFRFNQEEVTKVDTGFTSRLLYAGSKLTIDSLELGEKKISTAGFIDLEQIDKGLTEFAADLAFAESRLKITGSLDNKLVKAHVKTDNFDIGELQKRLGGAGWDISGKIKGEADLAFNVESQEELNGSFAFGVQAGKVHGVGLDSASLSGRFDKENLAILLAEARTPGNHILIRDVSVPVPLLQGGDTLAIIGGSKAKFGVDITDFATVLALIKIKEYALPDLARPNSLTVSGYLQNGTIYLDDAKAVASESRLAIDRGIIPVPATVEAFESVPIDLAARFESSNLQQLSLLVNGISASGQLTADMRITGSIKKPHGDITLSGKNLGYKDLQIGALALQGDVQLIQATPGTLQAAQFTVTELTQTNGSGALKLLTPAAADWQHDTFSMSGSFQLDGQGEVAIEIGKQPGKEIEAHITTSSLDSDGWLGNFIDNRYFFHGAGIKADFTGLPKSPQVQLAGTIDKAGVKDVSFPLAGSFSLQYSSKGIAISEFTWKSHERNQFMLSGYLPYDPMAPEPFLDNEMSLKGHIDFPALEDIGVILEPWGISKGSIAVDMDVTGSWNRPEGHIQFKAKGIEPPKTLLQYMDSAVDFSGDIAALGGAIVLQAANLDSSAYSAQATGSWKHGISVKELLQKRKAELKGEVVADATVKLKDLNFLRKKLPWLRRLEGDMQGELHVSGPVAGPAIKGSFSFKDGEASHTFNFPMLSAINLQGDFDEHSIIIKNMQAEMGGSPLNLKGRINKEQDSVDVNLQVDGKNVLLFRNNNMRMRGDVQLGVSGPLEHLVIKGTTGLTGGYYTRNIDFFGMIGSSSAPVSEGAGFLFSFTDPPLRDAVFDVKITTIEPFRIRNNLIRGVLRPELFLKGTGELPFLIGTVYIDPSRVLLPSGRLQIQSGLLRFLEGEPDRPQLDVIAQSKVLGYDINVVTQGPIDDPVITLSSSPALPNDDLMLLLLAGQPPKQDVTGGARSSGTTNVMVYLGRDFLNKWLEDESGGSDETILDRFELDFGRGITKSGEQTVESTFRLSKQAAGTGKIFYLSGEKDKYDAYNYGMKLVFRFE